jgi:hypothetical protein
MLLADYGWKLMLSEISIVHEDMTFFLRIGYVESDDGKDLYMRIWDERERFMGGTWIDGWASDYGATLIAGGLWPVKRPLDLLKECVDRAVRIEKLRAFA